ncbi:putative serine-type D-Ala-D-Ala carboxypeptidase [Candidatus Protochlamydia naegleriophila]|uniref:Putative serine-type D-Ala-D-Ala carboxypeptidase n=1 Tax=Candidatus Protochlamydia naegleriophila TaxID=389348 RepID=A0A0U5CML4_9BACT|nr:D-alanyl-D-alanine carboxypeptidase/D-alanyl-D-alanine-endopeptidase [Candidatus Protochlamydia naegleriophila]CUI15836.1 putative serine-type D-Ala-D-Ala carboxypeptidase [Candidatus Protochlamydia naegleriophila]
MIKSTSFTGLAAAILCCFSVACESSPLPQKMQTIMQKPKYKYANWGILARDAATGQILLDHQSDHLMLPASTTKLFSVAALMHTYGEDYRFRTPVFATGPIEDGVLKGDLILVGQGDLVMGGRYLNAHTIAFTPLDHTIANNVPGVVLTKEDPLLALNALAKEIRQKGIKQIEGRVMVDDRLFETTEKRGVVISPMMINENLIDLVINPSDLGREASVDWRPFVHGYSVISEVKTVAKGEPLNIEMSAEGDGKTIVVKGTIPIDQKDLVRTFNVQNPALFAGDAFIQALQAQGIAVNGDEKGSILPAEHFFSNQEPLAVWTSAPLSEYAKLILKVSHNIGADLIPMLLAVRKKEKTFEQGMLELGKFVKEEVKLSPGSYVFLDGAGGDDNRLTPQAEVELLHYLQKWPKKAFQKFYDALPILGVDGSLSNYAKDTPAVGKVRAKTGTGISFNLATQQLFLTTQTLAGYVEGQNGNLIEFMISVNNGQLPTIDDIFPIFEEISQMAVQIYDLTEPKH